MCPTGALASLGQEAAQSGMKRTKGLKRTAMHRGRSQRSKKSKGHLFPTGVDEQYRNWIRRQPCLMRDRINFSGAGPHLCYGVVQVCHVKSRGAGGSDHGNVVPMCLGAHDEQGRGIKTFERKWGINLASEAVQLFERYRLEQIGDRFLSSEDVD